MTEPWKNDYVDFSLEGPILVATYKECPTPITLAHAKTIRNCRLAFQGKKSYPLLVKTEGNLLMEMPARKYLSSPEASEGVTAAAFIARNRLVETVIWFFLAFAPNHIPTKVYHKEKPALKWLTGFA